MAGPISSRSHPAVVASIVVAVLAVTAFALVGIAYLMGWVGAREAAPATPGAIAIPGTQVAGSVPDPEPPRESVVTIPEPPKAAIPGH